MTGRERGRAGLSPPTNAAIPERGHRLLRVRVPACPCPRAGRSMAARRWLLALLLLFCLALSAASAGECGAESRAGSGRGRGGRTTAGSRLCHRVPGGGRAVAGAIHVLVVPEHLRRQPELCAAGCSGAGTGGWDRSLSRGFAVPFGDGGGTVQVTRPIWLQEALSGRVAPAGGIIEETGDAAQLLEHPHPTCGQGIRSRCSAIPRAAGSGAGRDGSRGRPHSNAGAAAGCAAWERAAAGRVEEAPPSPATAVP